MRIQGFLKDSCYLDVITHAGEAAAEHPWARRGGGVQYSLVIGHGVGEGGEDPGEMEPCSLRLLNLRIFVNKRSEFGFFRLFV